MEGSSAWLLAWLPHTHLPSTELHVAVPWDERVICTINTPSNRDELHVHRMLHPRTLQEVEAASCGPSPDGGGIEEQGHIPKGPSLRCDLL